MAASGSGKKTSGKSNGNKEPARGGKKEPAKAGKEDAAIAPATPVLNRVEEFRRIAQAHARGEGVMRPCDLRGHARRRHVRETILEDHATRIDKQAQGAGEKFEKLADSLFSFFRGTSLLFHRDLAGEDARMPTVLVLGDLHPGNFGVMPNADNVPIFSVNDFDDAAYGPFTWDLVRGALGFMLAAEVEGGLGAKKPRKIARKFLKGYADRMEHYADRTTEGDEELRPDNSPDIIRKLFDEARESRRSWLEDRYLDETGRGFRANEELTPVSSRRAEFQRLVDGLVKTNGIAKGGRLGKLGVKDVCIRHGQGTASLGLPRYYVLLDGPSEDAGDDIIIEFKRARRSALAGLVPENDFSAGEEGERIAHAQAVHLANGDVFYGEVEIDGMSFMTRERAPFREDIDMDDLSKSSWKEYARACGRALALAHARSDEAGRLDYDIEPAIVEAMQPVDLFVDDIMERAGEALKRLRRDHAFYTRDHALGAFGNMLKSYR